MAQLEYTGGERRVLTNQKTLIEKQISRQKQDVTRVPAFAFHFLSAAYDALLIIENVEHATRLEPDSG
jgi:hypothetical protein